MFGHPGLFAVPLDRPHATPAATTLEPPITPLARNGLAAIDRHKRGLHRYCSGCTDETGHVAWTADGRGSIPAIRWPSVEPAGGNTICVNCGQARRDSLGLVAPEWSTWPRTRVAIRRPADAVALSGDPEMLEIHNVIKRSP